MERQHNDLLTNLVEFKHLSCKGISVEFSAVAAKNYASEWVYIPFTMTDALAILEINIHQYIKIEINCPNIKSFSLCPISFGRIMLHNGWDIFKMAILLELDRSSQITLETLIDKLLDDIAREVEYGTSLDKITLLFMEKCIGEHFDLNDKSDFSEVDWKFKYDRIPSIAFRNWLFVNARINLFLSEGLQPSFRSNRTGTLRQVGAEMVRQIQTAC